MADTEKLKLDSIVQIGDTEYSVQAVNAEKLGGVAASDYARKSELSNQTVSTDAVTFGANDTVKFVAGNNVTIEGDDENKTITISATGGGGGGTGELPNITVSQEEPSGGETGDIWFKY